MDINSSHRDWLALSMVQGLGPVKCQQLLERFSSPNQIFNASVESLQQAGLCNESIDALYHPDQRMLDKCENWLQNSEHHLITLDDEDYPALLRSISAPPPVLFAVGNRQALQAVQFSIIGSRNPTNSGRELAQDFARELSHAGFSICSGLALGIDYHGHLGSLDASGITIAVLGNGPDIIYPARHRKLANQIRDKGLLLTEFFPGTSPTPGNFPRRNRIISGLSTGVLVVEAARKSGSLITAHYALEQGREVFAIPGSIHSPLARGTHYLIKQGAKLVENIEDILEELGPIVGWALESTITGKTTSVTNADLEPEYADLLEHMGFEVVSIDELVKSSGLTADAVSSMLLMMELNGLVESRHGGRYSRRT